MRLFFSCIVVVLLLTTHTTVWALGASTGFNVRTFVGGDTTPPSTPVLRDVVPATPTQINIVWDAATDDYQLSGYRLFRDGVQIATTTQTSFSDSGLTPSTLYTYTVDAFDSSSNFSSTSLPAATTTEALLVSPPTNVTSTTTPKKTIGTLILAVELFTITPKERSAVIHFQTNINTRYSISWGRTTSYELGTVSTTLFKQAHVTSLENLEPGTHYWYSIVVENTAGRTQVLKVGDFATIPAFQSLAPTNVRNIHAIAAGADVVLDWINPVLAEGSKVRVVRNYLFYPQSATDGALVYEGVGTTVTDTGALATRSPQYYTIFVIDAFGAISSGAVVIVTKAGTTMPLTPRATSSVASSSVSVPDSILDESGDATVLHADAVFVRQGLSVQAFSDGIKLDADIPYTVYIPITAVATHLKSILVSIKDPTDQRIVTTYLLKLNKDGDAYVADIDPPHVIGVAGMSVEVFDFNQASVRRLTAPITFITPQNPTMLFPDNLIFYARTYGVDALLLLGTAVFLWWFLVFRRRREDNN